MSDIETTLKDAHAAIAELREEKAKTVQDREKIERLEKALDAYEDANAKLNASLAEQKAKAEAMEDQIKVLVETAAAAGGVGSGAGAEERKAFAAFMQTGERKSILRTDSSIDGGFLVPQAMEDEIIKNITEFSPVRQFARVMNTVAKSTEMPRRLNNLRAQYEGERETSETDNAQYGTETITVHRLTVTVPATNDLLLAIGRNMEAEITADVAEAFGSAESLNFVSGDGVKKPHGFTADDRVARIDTATSGQLKLDDLISVSGELKRGYDPRYMMNRRTLAYLRLQKTTDGQYLWSPAVSEGAPATLNGFTYSADFIDMDDHDAGAGGIPVAFGDMRQAYRIYDRIGTTVVRDEYTRKKEGIVEWTFYRFNGGGVVKPEALKLLRIKA